MEFTVSREALGDVTAVLKRACKEHLPEYDIFPLYRENTGDGLGRAGRFSRPRNLVQLAMDIKAALALKMVKIAGSEALQVETAAVCSGGGGGMVKDFLASGAQVFISGDLNHHAALDIAASGRALVDIGHFASERIIVSRLCDQIREGAEKAGFTLSVIPWDQEPDPFTWV